MVERAVTLRSIINCTLVIYAQEHIWCWLFSIIFVSLTFLPSFLAFLVCSRYSSRHSRTYLFHCCKCCSFFLSSPTTILVGQHFWIAGRGALLHTVSIVVCLTTKNVFSKWTCVLSTRRRRISPLEFLLLIWTLNLRKSMLFTYLIL